MRGRKEYAGTAFVSIQVNRAGTNGGSFGHRQNIPAGIRDEGLSPVSM